MTDVDRAADLSSDLPSDLPMLGEPLPIELANTWYADGDEVVDFLEGSAAAAAWCIWFAHVVPSAGFQPTSLDDTDQTRLRALRDAVRALIEARVDRTDPPRAAIELVNAHAAAAPPTVQLEWSNEDDADGPVVVAAPRADDATAAMGLLAAASIELLTGTSRDALARCAADDCSMLFVRHHGRRRFCHDSCSHRKRQARYAARHHATTTDQDHR